MTDPDSLLSMLEWLTSRLMKIEAEAIDDFVQVARLAGVSLKKEDIEKEILDCPHSPPSNLPPRKMAVYVFFYGDQCLKVGKAGPRSKARYTSQHYNPKSARSNLAKSILDNRNALGLANLNEENIGDWIKENTDRLNLLVSVDVGSPVHSLLEVFLQCRLKPRYEGFKNQK